MQTNKHELLSPAGDFECLRAAVCGGADAVYFGASSFNARARAANFSDEEIKRAIDYLHTYGKKAYITLNTALKERELSDALSLASKLYSFGVDALICADIGLISQIKKQIPELEVHISTQAGVRSTAGADLFSNMGASRVVLAREMSMEEIRDVTRDAKAEIEVFIHGALCVSVSGRCLFSSLVGGRSGNRGECAQPCRLPYDNGNYLLSLKDLCLAKHISELCSIGVASFKIEGRMKSPEYVYSVSKIYRELIDAARDATDKEVEELAKIFSRGGFTDGYYTGRIGHSMNGIRGELTEPKRQLTQRLEEPKREVSIKAKIKRGEPFSLEMSTKDGTTAKACGDAPIEAQNRPMQKEDYLRPLAALGNTPFFATSADIEADEGLMLPVSVLKNARRSVVDELLKTSIITRESAPTAYSPIRKRNSKRIRSAKFFSAKAVTKKAREFFDVVFVPINEFDPSVANGAYLPEVTREGSVDTLITSLSSLKEKGCEHILASDIGQLALVRDLDFSIHTDIGFNVYNREEASLLENEFSARVLASPELNLPAQRDLGCGITVYGRIPLMTLEKCIGRELIGCDRCKSGDGRFSFKDRKGVTFTGMRACTHGSVIFNSLPTYIGDREESRSLSDIHFIFTLEEKSEVDSIINAYEKGLPLDAPVRRIK